MKSLDRRRMSILRKVEEADNDVKFQEFSVHSVGGFEVIEIPGWTREEGYEIEQLLQRGFLAKSETNGDEPWLNEPGPDSIHKVTYVSLTPAGHDFLENSNWLRYGWLNIKRNWPTVIVGLGLSILTAVSVSWAQFYWGAPQ
ncbi:hypothetical protein [Rhodobacter ferrooxidans]|uniref:hypothetical protein n=1 Tax=Rhodobacter ferrooxidans TaxID=371731 RepID=UPI0012EA7A93|nr:hypothetical protein [Rhodobacter sp. SW2]